MYKGELARIGNNQMLACDTATGETRRFLTGPTNCEVTGVAFTPDSTTMFVSIQHPGETPSDRSDPAKPTQYSNWPDYAPNGRPRSSLVAIRKMDGGIIGS
jgi:secreted PhoX family phosphatase